MGQSHERKLKALESDYAALLMQAFRGGEYRLRNLHPRAHGVG
jgi:hypothetical protein